QEQIARISQEQEQAGPSAGLHIGYIGSIAPQKGIHILIDAVNQLPAQDITLTLYGGLDAFPGYVAQLRHMARHPGIRFAGRIARAEVWEALAACDVVVMPTLWYESSPAVIDEVMAVRTPIIASHIGSMPEKIRHAKDGLLFPVGDAKALAQILGGLHQSPNQLARLRAGIRPVRTMDEHVQDILDLYMAVLFPLL
ncbi:MAG: glycosyltransferase, partial [Anaerolineae bacterium]